MKITVTLFATLLFASSSLLAALGGTKPSFSGDGKYIVLDAQGGLCGGITIKPKEGYQDVELISYRTNLSLTGDVEQSEKVGMDVLEPAGKRYKYDWGGGRPSYGFKIYCRGRTKDTQTKQVNCEDVVELSDNLHNVSCLSFFGLGGAQADYGKLNMERNSPNI